VRRWRAKHPQHEGAIMPKRFRLTRRFPVAMTEDGYRKLKRFSADAGLDDGEALSFLFENFNSVINEENLTARLRLFNTELDAPKKMNAL
jgi:hypothetical protein